MDGISGLSTATATTTTTKVSPSLPVFPKSSYGIKNGNSSIINGGYYGWGNNKGIPANTQSMKMGNNQDQNQRNGNGNGTGNMMTMLSNPQAQG